jgi:hypothetical protein
MTHTSRHAQLGAALITPTPSHPPHSGENVSHLLQTTCWCYSLQTSSTLPSPTFRLLRRCTERQAMQRSSCIGTCRDAPSRVLGRQLRSHARPQPIGKVRRTCISYAAMTESVLSPHPDALTRRQEAEERYVGCSWPASCSQHVTSGLLAGSASAESLLSRARQPETGGRSSRHRTCGVSAAWQSCRPSWSRPGPRRAVSWSTSSQRTASLARPCTPRCARLQTGTRK